MLVGLSFGDFRLHIMEKVEDANNATLAGSAAAQTRQQMLGKKAFGSIWQHIGGFRAPRRSKYHPTAAGLERIIITFWQRLEFGGCCRFRLTDAPGMAAIEYYDCLACLNDT